MVVVAWSQSLTGCRPTTPGGAHFVIGQGGVRMLAGMLQWVQWHAYRAATANTANACQGMRACHDMACLGHCVRPLAAAGRGGVHRVYARQLDREK
jgi:hypothetical protein